jgi:hypothetical protein
VTGYFRAVSVALIVALASSAYVGAGGQKHITINGSIVAYANSISCMNGGLIWTSIVRVEDPKPGDSAYVVLYFGTECLSDPKWLEGKSKVREFKVVESDSCEAIPRGTDADAPDEKASTKKDGGATDVEQIPGPFWNYVKGADRKAVPFGKKVPCYESVQYPVRPVL